MTSKLCYVSGRSLFFGSLILQNIAYVCTHTHTPVPLTSLILPFIIFSLIYVTPAILVSWILLEPTNTSYPL